MSADRPAIQNGASQTANLNEYEESVTNRALAFVEGLQTADGRVILPKRLQEIGADEELFRHFIRGAEMGLKHNESIIG